MQEVLRLVIAAMSTVWVHNCEMQQMSGAAVVISTCFIWELASASPI